MGQILCCWPVGDTRRLAAAELVLRMPIAINPLLEDSFLTTCALYPTHVQLPTPTVGEGACHLYVNSVQLEMAKLLIMSVLIIVTMRLSVSFPLLSTCSNNDSHLYMQSSFLATLLQPSRQKSHSANS